MKRLQPTTVRRAVDNTEKPKVASKRLGPEGLDQTRVPGCVEFLFQILVTRLTLEPDRSGSQLPAIAEIGALRESASCSGKKFNDTYLCLRSLEPATMDTKAIYNISGAFGSVLVFFCCQVLL